MTDAFVRPLQPYWLLMATDLYKTLAGPSEGLYKDKGSRFLSFAFPVSSVEEAMSLVEDLRKRYHDARHCCYAYSVGVDSPQTRANDDGEPSGTAGRPILGQIRSFGLDNVLIAVVRYFGGVLLGTGGLTVAYKSAAADALEKAQTVEKTLEDAICLSCDYLCINEVMKLVKEEKLGLVDPVYDQVCTMTLRVPKSSRESLENRLLKIESLRLLESV